MKKFLLFAILCICSLLIFAQAKDKPTVHKVIKGETLYSISKKYHVTVAAIEKANKVTGEMKLKLGQSITIPATAKADAKPAPATSAEAKKTDKSASDKASAKPAATADKATAKTATDKKPGDKTTTTTTTVKKTTVTTGIKSPIEKSTANTTTAKPAKPTTADDNPSSHTVAKGETLYSLARVYGVSVKHLKEANNMHEDVALKTGQKLHIPSKNPEADYKPIPQQAKAVEKPGTRPEAGQPGREYLANDNAPVQKTERAVEKPMEKPVEKVEKKEPEVAKTAPVPVVSEEKPTTPAVTDKPKEIIKEEKAPERKEPVSPPAEAVKNSNVAPSGYVSVFNDYGTSGKKKVVYRGIGSFLKSDNPGNQYLALYNYADMGTILKVTNLMSKQAIYVKVIGKVPAADAQNDIILKVSAEAATQLKVSEDKFLVEVTGYNEQ